MRPKISQAIIDMFTSLYVVMGCEAQGALFELKPHKMPLWRAMRCKP
jgi:hypothetical protein